jgi:two-component system alkaline phosphatase synthesis response regulator PhoP
MAKILIIDDDPDLVFALKLCLEGAGYEVSSAACGKDGLLAIEQDKPDLIILDVMMDSTTDGFQVALKLRSADPSARYYRYRTIPLIMLTAIHQTTELRYGRDEDYLPVDEFVEKPIDPDQLLRKVERLLQADSVGQETADDNGDHHR